MSLHSTRILLQYRVAQKRDSNTFVLTFHDLKFVVIPILTQFNVTWIHVLSITRNQPNVTKIDMKDLCSRIWLTHVAGFQSNVFADVALGIRLTYLAATIVYTCQLPAKRWSFLAIQNFSTVSNAYSFPQAFFPYHLCPQNVATHHFFMRTCAPWTARYRRRRCR